MNIKKRQTWSVILSILGVTGTVVTAVLVRKGAKKEIEKRLDFPDIEKQIGRELTKTEVIREVLPVYIPSMVVGVSTIAAIVSSKILDNKTQASLASMAILADQGWKRYKNEVKSAIGLDGHNKIIKNIANQDFNKLDNYNLPTDVSRSLFYEEHVGYFTADSNQIGFAYGDLNQRINVIDIQKELASKAMMYDFLKQINAKSLNEEGFQVDDLVWGWTYEYLNDVYGSAWVHMILTEETMPDGTPFTIITWKEEPILDPESYGGGLAYIERVKHDRYGYGELSDEFLDYEEVQIIRKEDRIEDEDELD